MHTALPLRSDALMMDLYELTMAYGYWKSGKENQEAVFHLFYRKQPFGSGFSVAAGLESVAAYVSSFHFSDADLRYLATLEGNDNKPLLSTEFLDYLAGLRLALDIDAVSEGTVVFPQEPLIRVRGPILQAQMIETALLTFVNFETLIATKSARMCMAAAPDPVIEFGLRRAQGPDGGLTASRSAYIGGCAGTSNVLAGKLLHIPLKGTHAHSWVMAFEDELESFEAYASALPNNCIFLVDTYNSLAGVRHAIQVGLKLRARGCKLAGIRLDSGDLAYLSSESRKILDAAGFKDTLILGGNDLDEHLITSLRQQGATINVWAVGTRLVTGYGDPALGGVYKLSALRMANGSWVPKVKISEQLLKSSNPGILQVRRFRSEKEFIGDAIYNELEPLPASFVIVDPGDATRRKQIPPGSSQEDLLQPVFKSGEIVWKKPAIEEIRTRTQQQLSMLHPGVKRFLNPHEYPAGLELSLHDAKTEIVLSAKGRS